MHNNAENLSGSLDQQKHRGDGRKEQGEMRHCNIKLEDTIKGTAKEIFIKYKN